MIMPPDTFSRRCGFHFRVGEPPEFCKGGSHGFILPSNLLHALLFAAYAPWTRFSLSLIFLQVVGIGPDALSGGRRGNRWGRVRIRTKNSMPHEGFLHVQAEWAMSNGFWLETASGSGSQVRVFCCGCGFTAGRPGFHCWETGE